MTKLTIGYKFRHESSMKKLDKSMKMFFTDTNVNFSMYLILSPIIKV
ncbi:MAG: hypothetical protein ACFFDK_12815 [Promethearchaeota archaeon]